MVRKSDLFDEFRYYLCEEPVPEIDFEKSREAIYEKLDSRSRTSGTRPSKKRLLLVAAIAACLAAYPVYAVTYSYFRELKGSDENLSVKFQTATDEIKELIEDNAAGDTYINENFHDVLQERYNALGPGQAEKIIVRSPDGYRTGFFTSSLVKENYITRFELFAAVLNDKAGFEHFKPDMELPGGFVFDKGQYIYKGDWYTSEEEMEALMAEAESNGKNYAVKPINYTDQIDCIVMQYKNESDEGATLSVYVENVSNDTYILPEGTTAEEIYHNGDAIITHGLPDENEDTVKKVYYLVKNDLFYRFIFAKDIGNDNAVEIIDAFIGSSIYEDREAETVGNTGAYEEVRENEEAGETETVRNDGASEEIRQNEAAGETETAGNAGAVEEIMEEEAAGNDEATGE